MSIYNSIIYIVIKDKCWKKKGGGGKKGISLNAKLNLVSTNPNVKVG